ncbi:MAG: D-glycero-beta-D-manno-heptose-7-phosphate kinase [Endomicrobiales bacterium]|nr:D-glycero-beta-D-manno-heptose-7-phosphate kinase [Endomicrobiales bacterium]
MEKLLRFIPKFTKQKILVLGDIMVDKFVWGKVSRISPEAPVPVVETTKETYSFGGAGNVANNLRSLGAQVYISGIVGNDMVGNHLRDELLLNKINAEGLICDYSRPTIIKTRIIAAHQQIVRVDREVKGELPKSLNQRIIRYLDKIIPHTSAVIISDYGKGMINKTILRKAISLASKQSIPVVVDPKIEHFLQYKNVSCITPNLSEAISGMRSHEISEDKDINNLGFKILKRLRSKSVLITRGEKGMTLYEPGNKTTHIPTRAREVFDVTGAGDTVIASFTLAVASNASFSEAAELSNFAAGIVVGKLGTATVTPAELKAAITNYKE